MDKVINKLFSDYISQVNITTEQQYTDLAKKAFEKEKELRYSLNEQQTQLFEQLFELTSQIHYLEVKNAFHGGCKSGAAACKELSI